MKYHHQPWQIPEETVQIAKAAFPKGSPYMLMRDKIGILYANSEFEHLFSHRGKPAEAPGNLALVMIMQYGEGLTDEQAAQAVRGRIDWKYALGLRLSDPGFDGSVLSRFRQRIIEGGEERKLLDNMLAHFMEQGWLKTKEQRTDATHVIGAIRGMNRLEVVGETMRAALSALAVIAPNWLRERVTEDWYELYGPRFEEYRLPSTEKEQEQLRLQIGQDGYELLTAVYKQGVEEIPLSYLPAVQILRRVWLQQYYRDEEGVRWRQANELPPAAKLIESPYDVEAHYARKRETKWVGYKAHLTETCTPGTPHIITHVTTTPATMPDESVTQEIQQALAEKGMSPETHYMDGGYVDADNLAQAQQQGVELLGPAPPDTSWQGKDPQAFDLSHFDIDWEQEVAICPEGHSSRTWSVRHDKYQNKVIDVCFHQKTCQQCSARHLCTQAKTSGRRLKLRDQKQHNALQLARQRQQEEEFPKQYHRRAGVEGTISQGVRSFHLRSCRYIGMAKTHLQHILIAAAMNVTRMVCWLRGDKHARSRVSPFAALAFNLT